MRTESLLKHLSFVAHSSRAAFIVPAGIIAIGLFLMPGRCETGPTLVDGRTPPSRATLLVQDSADVLDCPLLPGCPSGPSVPLPPVFGDEPEVKKSVPAPSGGSLSEGTGKYANMVLIPAGSFEMGSSGTDGRPDEHPSHKVFVKDFYVAKEPVTVKMYCKFLNGDGPNTADGLPRVGLDNPDCPVTKDGNRFIPKEGLADMPMVCVCWYGASDYAHWAGGRLPTAAEREKAASMTVTQPAEDKLVFRDSEFMLPARRALVGAAGVAGMTGNVWEWCADWYSRDYYAESPKEDPAGPPLGQEKEIRGGSYCSPEASQRIQNRHKAVPRGYFRAVGFRIVKD